MEFYKNDNTMIHLFCKVFQHRKSKFYDEFITFLHSETGYIKYQYI